MEKELESDSEKLDVLQFLFIGRTTGSGKSNSLQILQKMLGLSKSKPIFCTITLFRLEEQKKQTQ